MKNEIKHTAHSNYRCEYHIVFNRHFGCRGYFVDTVGENEKKIREYIRNQLEEDFVKDQISMMEYIDPFTGEKVR